MLKLISLDKNYTIKLKSQSAKFLNPDVVYFPVESENIHPKKNVKKGSKLYKETYASVSGKIIGFKKCSIFNEKKRKCLALLNDFQEKSDIHAMRKKISHLTKEEVLSSLFDEDLKQKLSSLDIHTFLISGIDDEPYLANEVFIQKENTKCILEVLDLLLHLFPGSQAMLAIKNTDSENILSYQNFLGTYKNIELRMVEDLYLIGEEVFLTKYFHVKENYIYLKTSTLFSLYGYLKKRKPDTEKYITITGNGIINPQVVVVKLGTRVKDIYNHFYEESLEDKDIYVNGIMRGFLGNIENMIVTKDFQGLVIMKKEFHKTYDCIKCGKCIAVCPIRSNPMLAYKNKKKVRCITCGLCSYICPSYIPLRDYLGGDKDE